MGHLAADCEGKAKRKAGELDEKGSDVAKKPYQVIYLCCIFEKSLVYPEIGHQ